MGTDTPVLKILTLPMANILVGVMLALQELITVCVMLAHQEHTKLPLEVCNVLFALVANT